MFWEDPYEKVTFYLSTDLSEVRKQARWTSGGQAFQAGGMEVQRSWGRTEPGVSVENHGAGAAGAE